MAKSRSRRRDAHVIANAQALPFSFASTRLMDSHDLRNFQPEVFYDTPRSLPPYRAFVKARPRVQSRSVRGRVPRMFSPLATVFGFTAPSKVLVCIRRKRRREVLHALRKAGRRGQARPKFNRFSHVYC